MKRTFLLLLAFGLFCQNMSAQTAPKTYEYKNGLWYDGKGFSPATWYVSGGVLSKKAPLKIDSSIDLQNRWVVPPFGDAHCSSVSENPSASSTLTQYMGEGVFYLQIMGNTQEGRNTTTPLLGKAGSPDASFANGPVTCTLGYPFLKYEGPANKLLSPTEWSQRYDMLKTSRKMFGNGYWFIDNKEALAANWPKILAQKPANICIYLLDAQNSGGKEGRGLSAEVAKLVVKKAHKSGLRVWAHVETADDLRLGLKLEVDGFANCPGYNWDGKSELKKFELSDADVKQLAKKKTPIALLFAQGQMAVNRSAAQEFHKKTFNRLLDGGANIVIGSDDPQRSIRVELNYWFAFGYLDNARTLKILCENTPRAIFPERKIGKFENGYEASFLVLNDDPFANVLKVRMAALKVKNGVVLK